MQNNYNPNRPLIMHIDLNSCFASIEQQARPTLRGRPVGIVNRATEHTAVVTASYEAKAMGVKVGMKLAEARTLCPDIIGVESDPAKYRYVYHKLMAILSRYSPAFVMKSIDEGVIDFTVTSQDIQSRDMIEIGHEIKQALRDEVGCAMRCNVGIGTNRFLAKMAAGLHKPDGLDVIDADNLRQVMGRLKLQDLTGIAKANAHRLEAVGITTPLEFLDADPVTLQKIVFKSICGLQWHQRLRGWEVDDVEYDLKTCGRQYVLESPTLSREDVRQRLHHLSEAVGAKLRSQDKCARGVGIYIKSQTRGYWHQKALAPLPFYSDAAIWQQADKLFQLAPDMPMREIGIHCYHLHDHMSNQMSLFGDQLARMNKVTNAVDAINQTWGERTIHSADTLGTGMYVKAKIPFGSTRYM